MIGRLNLLHSLTSCSDTDQNLLGTYQTTKRVHLNKIKKILIPKDLSRNNNFTALRATKERNDSAINKTHATQPQNHKHSKKKNGETEKRVGYIAVKNASMTHLVSLRLCFYRGENRIAIL